MFLHAEMHGMPMHVSSLSIYDPSALQSKKIEFKEIIELFERKVQYDVPFLRYKVLEVPLNIDQPYWVEDQNFDLVYHVRHIALPRPCNWQKLCSLAANLHAQPLNRSRPLWEAYVIDGLDSVEAVPAGCFAILLKVHQSLMDGRIAMAIFNSLHQKFGGGNHTVDVQYDEILHEGNSIVSSNNQGLSGILARAVMNNVSRSVKLLRILSRSPLLYSNIQNAIKAKDFKQLQKPKTRFNGKISARRVVDRLRLPIADLNLISEAFPEVSVSDIALSVISGGLRKYLISKDELPEDPLVAAVPINIPWDSEETLSQRSRVNITNISLRTDIVDPVKRLVSVHEEAEAGRLYARILGGNITSEMLDSLYAGFVSWGVKAAVDTGLLEKFPPANNTIVTKAQSSSEPLFLCGARLVESFGMGPLIPNTGLFHAVSRTYDFFTIAFTADRQKMDDPDYRLAPEHPYPAALEDSIKVYKWLLEQGYKPEHIVIAGDSAGGGLTYGTVLKIRDLGLPLPAATAGMSPWTDLAVTGESVITNLKRDVLIPGDGLPEGAQYYLAGADPRDPYASPLYGDPTGLPPTMIQVSKDEVLLDDSRRLAAKYKAAGVPCELELWDGMPHVWQTLAMFIPEGKTAIKRMGDFIARHVRDQNTV